MPGENLMLKNKYLGIAWCYGHALVHYFNLSLTHTFSLPPSRSLTFSRPPPTHCHSLALSEFRHVLSCTKNVCCTWNSKRLLCSMFLFFVSIVYVYLHAPVHEIVVMCACKQACVCVCVCVCVWLCEGDWCLFVCGVCALVHVEFVCNVFVVLYASVCVVCAFNTYLLWG